MIKKLKKVSKDAWNSGLGILEMYIFGKVKDLFFTALVITMVLLLIWGYLVRPAIHKHHADQCDDMMVEIMKEIRK